MDDVRDTFYRNGLVRSDDRVLAGVCAGLGRRIGLGPGASRVLFVLVLLLLPGSQLLVYPVLWLLMPDTAWVQRRPSAGGPVPFG